MQWYNVQLQQDAALRVNGHLRAVSASEAIRVALGRERRWPVQETGQDAARAVDPENPENWCKANGVKGPAWPSTVEAQPKKKAAKRRKPVKVAAGAKAKTPAKSKAKAAPAKARASAKSKAQAAPARKTTAKAKPVKGAEAAAGKKSKAAETKTKAAAAPVKKKAVKTKAKAKAKVRG